MLLILALLIAALLALRIAGELKFVPRPEALPNVDVSDRTTLYRAVQKVLDGFGTPNRALYHPLGDPHLALLTRFELAELAEKTLDVQYYLFHDDESGRALLANLIDAAHRGVQVRLLLDDIDTNGREDLFTRIAAETDNLEIRIFNPTLLRSLRFIEYIARFPRVTRRMHNKSYTVDSIASIVGGRNIGNEYFDRKSDVTFTDFDVLAAGDIVTEVVTQFNEYWHSGVAVDASRLASPASDKKYSTWMASLDSAQAVFRDKLSTVDTLVSRQLANSDLGAFHAEGRVVYDRPSKVLSRLTDTTNSLAPDIMDLLSSAKELVVISSPYFIPGKMGLKVLSELRERGVRIAMLTNSYTANDVAIVHAGYIDYRRALLEMGVELYEFRPDEIDHSFSVFGSKRSTLHAKAVVIDRRNSFVGSFNLDPRSAIHNTEMGIIFESVEFGTRASDRIESSLGTNAYRVQINKRNRLEWVESDADGNETIHKTEPGMSRTERGALYLMSWLPVEWLM